jgi:hypothetical protein
LGDQPTEFTSWHGLGWIGFIRRTVEGVRNHSLAGVKIVSKAYSLLKNLSVNAVGELQMHLEDAPIA